MAVTNEVILKLIADNSKFRQAMDDSRKAADKVKGGVQNIGSTFAGVGKAAAGLAVAIGGVVAALGSAKLIGASIAAARQQEDATNAVAFALARAGENVRTALPDIESFASKLQDLTGVGDEATLKMVNLAMSFGASKDQAKEVVEAAIELSAATGKGLDESVKQVAKTLGGLAGELGEVNPAIKALTKDQLKAGEAARILLDQYGGTAASKLDTFSGALTATKGRFGDMLETIGDLIIKNPAVIAVIQSIGDGFIALGDYISGSGDTIRAWISSGILAVVEIVPGFLRALDNMVQGFQIVMQASPFPDMKIQAEDVTETFRLVSLMILDLVQSWTFAAREAALIGRKLGIVSRETYQALQSTDAELVKLIDRISNPSDGIGKASEDSLTSIGKLANGIEGLADKIKDLPSTKTINFEMLEKVSQASGGRGGVGGDGSGTPGNPIVVDVEEGDKTPEVEIGKSPELAKELAKVLSNENIASVLESAMGIFSGAQGAGATVGSGIGAIASLAGAGPLGPVIGQLATELAKGPEHVRQMVTEFAEAFPKVLGNIAEAIPVLIDTLVDKAPDIITALVKESPRISIAITKAMADPRLWLQVAAGLLQAIWEVITEELGRWGEDLGAFFSDIGGVIASLPEKLLEGVDALVDFIQYAIPEAFSAFFEGIGDAFNELIRQITGQGSGGGEGLIAEAGKNISDLWKGKKKLFATGGFVTGIGTGDVVPAMLTPGELVIDRETGPMLRQFLKDAHNAPRETSSRPSNDMGNVEALLSKLVSMMGQDRQPVMLQVDGRQLANVMLDLSRRNQRLTA